MSTYTVLKAEFDINGTKSSRAGRQDMLFCCSQKVRNKAERSHITLNARNFARSDYDYAYCYFSKGVFDVTSQILF